MRRNKRHQYPAHVIEKIVAWTDEGMSPGWIARELTKLQIPTARGYQGRAWEDYAAPEQQPEPWSRSTVVTLQAQHCTENAKVARENAAKIEALTPEEKIAYRKMYDLDKVWDQAQDLYDEEQHILKVAEDPTHPDHDLYAPHQLENARIRESERKTAQALKVMAEAMGLDVLPADFREPLAWDSEDRKMGRVGEMKYGGGIGDADNEIALSKLIDWMYRTDKRDLYTVLDKALEGDGQAKREIKYLIRRLAGEAAIQRQANLALLQRMTRSDLEARQEDIGREGMVIYQDPRYTAEGRPKYRHDDPREV